MIDMATNVIGWADLPLFSARMAGCTYQRHSQTSKDAAIKAVPGAKTQRFVILRLFRDAGARGLTDDEIEAMTGYKGSAVRPRRIKLCDDGLIEKSDVTRPTRSGRDAVVWKIKQKKA